MPLLLLKLMAQLYLLPHALIEPSDLRAAKALEVE
jgi:hypothetical protein